MTTTAVCVLRSGGREYRREHVVDLMAQIEDHWPVEAMPLRRAVLTDTPIEMDGVEEWPLNYPWLGWWSKMELFHPHLLGEGDLLYFDLDTVIVGDLHDLLMRTQLTVLEDFYRPTHMGSGLMYLPASCRPEMWDAWMENPGRYMRKYGGDQNFLEFVWRDKVQYWQHVLPGQVCSYKVHVKRAGGVPEGTRVVCFHGRPRPWAVKGGWQNVQV